LHIDRLSITELLEFTIEPIWDLLEQPIEINIHFYCNVARNPPRMDSRTKLITSKRSGSRALLGGAANHLCII
jgi:hypothetical protein